MLVLEIDFFCLNIMFKTATIFEGIAVFLALMLKTGNVLHAVKYSIMMILIIHFLDRNESTVTGSIKNYIGYFVVSNIFTAPSIGADQDTSTDSLL